MSAVASLDALRARIRALEGAARVERRRVPAGIEAIDELLGGLPCPGIVEISGAVGSGRTRLALALVAAVTRTRRRTVAWVDPLRMLYPPAAASAGVPLEQLLIVRPPASPIHGVHPEVWATEQLLRSGNFPLVVCMAPERREASGGRAHRAGGHQWARAAEKGQCTAVVLSERPQRDLPAEVRLAVADGELRVLRDRGGASPEARALPEAEGLLPW